MAEHRKPKKMWPIRIALAVLISIALMASGFCIYASDYYRAGTQAQTLIEAGADGESVAIVESDSTIAVGDSSSSYGIVLYPGAKVAPEAYVPLAAKLANKGVYIVIAKMPFNFAFFNINAADDAMESAPHIEHWWIAGHSLGGAMAAQYASSNANKLEGIALLEAYAASNLSATNLKALVIYGTKDEVLNRDKLESNAGNLPKHSQTIAIEGGNHAGIADYGPQEGDGKATIAAEEQQTQTANLIASAMIKKLTSR